MVALLWLVIWIVVTASLASRGFSNRFVLAAALAGPLPVLIAAAMFDLHAPAPGGPAQPAVSNLLVAGILCAFYGLVVAVAVYMMQRARRED